MNDLNRTNFLTNVVSIILKGKTYFQGVFLNQGSKWSLLQYIPVDYVLDGYVIINNSYISNLYISDDDVFTENIVKLKNINYDIYSSLNLNDDENLFNDLMKENGLVKIELKDHNKSYIGKIINVMSISIDVYLIDSRCNWLQEETFLYKEIRAIYLKDDYLNSLQLYLEANIN